MEGLSGGQGSADQAQARGPPSEFALAEAAPDRRSRERTSGPRPPVPERAVPIFIGALQPEPPGQQLADSFTVQDFGEYPTHYQSLGIEIDPPEGAPGNYPRRRRAPTISSHPARRCR